MSRIRAQEGCEQLPKGCWALQIIHAGYGAAGELAKRHFGPCEEFVHRREDPLLVRGIPGPRELDPLRESLESAVEPGEGVSVLGLLPAIGEPAVHLERLQVGKAGTGTS